MKEKKSIKVKGIKKLDKIEMNKTSGGYCQWGDDVLCFDSHAIIARSMPIVADHLIIFL
ncbi:MAG: hypothetical protein GY757_33190 [bacterium]|nr:hypothetical protein [bacterium]